VPVAATESTNPSVQPAHEKSAPQRCFFLHMHRFCPPHRRRPFRNSHLSAPQQEKMNKFEAV
jgi:hypothetical protein